MADRVTYQLQVCEIIHMEETQSQGAAVVSPCDVTPERDTREGEEKFSMKEKWRRFWAGSSWYIPVTFCIISLTSLTIIIALSTQLSLVTQQYDETSVTLEMLQQERELLNSSLTTDGVIKDYAAWWTPETLGKANEELEITEKNLLGSQEEQKTINQNLERTIQVEMGNAMTELGDHLMNTECNNSTGQESKDKVNRLPKETELSVTRRILQRVQSHLQKSQKNLQEQLRKLNGLEERLSELEDKLRDAKLCNQEERLGAICPGGWEQIDNMCYYFSRESKVRLKAGEHCRRKNATLAKIQERDSALKMLVEKDGRSFWIGLRRVNNQWKWSDDSLQQHFKLKSHDWCAKASPELESHPCATPLPWICQKKVGKYH